MNKLILAFLLVSTPALSFDYYQPKVLPFCETYSNYAHSVLMSRVRGMSVNDAIFWLGGLQGDLNYPVIKQIYKLKDISTKANIKFMENFSKNCKIEFNEV